MSCNTVIFKRGSSFAASCVYTPEEGGPANLAGITVTSTIIDANKASYDLTVEMGMSLLDFTAYYIGDTSGWATGTARWDIRFSEGTTVFYSETMRLDVIGQVTE